MPTESDLPNGLGRKLSELASYSGDDPGELLKDRFLCCEGLLGIYGPTGIGKSSLAMQFMLQWALGRDAFGIKPKRPLKSVLIQGENDDGDMAEMRDGIVAGLKLTPEDAKNACDNIIVIHEDSRIGSEFIEKTVRLALEQHKPDLIWIDPALQYLGGDSISQEIVGGFLRNLLKPLLKLHHCACVIVHHVNKSGRTDTAYAGSGSSEWANMPRAILTLSPSGKGTFELVAVKRGARLHWRLPNGQTSTTTKLLRHSTVEGRIFWQEIDGAEIETHNVQNKVQLVDDAILAWVPEEGMIAKIILLRRVNVETRIGQNKLWKAINELIRSGKLIESTVPRTNGPAERHVSRPPPSKAVTPG